MARSILNIWRNRSQIIEGVKNTYFKRKYIEKIAEARMKICSDCPLIDREGSKCMIPGTQPCCGECGCKLRFKTRSLSSECPHPDGPKWDSILKPEEEDKIYGDIGFNPDE